jgi:recombination protein RecR
MSSDPIRRLVEDFSRLPGVGERTALRLALYLLEQKKDHMFGLAQSLIDVAKNVRECSTCCNLTAFSDLCSICQKPGRDAAVLCVVSCIQDLMAIEASASFRGYYHVLHGVLKPIQGIGPKELRLDALWARLQEGTPVSELILATPSTVEGEATAIYIGEQAKSSNVRISRILSGVPVGGELQFADRLSLSRALTMRQIL